MKIKILVLFSILVFSSTLLSGQGMIIEPNAYVSVRNGGKLIITDATNGKLRIKSTSAGTGSLLVDNTAGSSLTVPSNNAYVERYLALAQWHYISSPLSNGLSGIFLMDYLRTSDQTATSGWAPYIASTTDPLDVMRGYAVWKPASNAAWQEVFNGNLNNGNLSINIGWLAGDWAGWHLVGNPYPCAIDLTTGVTWNNVESTAWFWNGSAGNYQAWPTNGINTGIYNGGTHPGIVPAMQGFYVHSTNATASLALTNASRVNTAQAFLKSTTDPHLIIRAQGYANSYFDVISVLFNPDATASYDQGYDAYKLYGLTEAPQLYTQINDTNVSCNSLPFGRADITIPMGFSCGVAGNYTLIADSLGTFDSNVAIMLEDLKLSITQSLRSNPVYNFSYATTDNSNRFLLHFDNPYFGISDLQSGPDLLQIYSYENFIYIRKTGTEPLIGKMSVYDLLGRELFTCNLSDALVSKYEVNLNEGYYIVKVISDEFATSKKVFIR
ncbi:MAG: T9SS type A sorting domain-containing protein [Bacteroidetes bacterium]|nr:T9SS type A sorting domain-containing protein [Bacteroidota bacterium]